MDSQIKTEKERLSSVLHKLHSTGKFAKQDYLDFLSQKSFEYSRGKSTEFYINIILDLFSDSKQPLQVSKEFFEFARARLKMPQDYVCSFFNALEGRQTVSGGKEFTSKRLPDKRLFESILSKSDSSGEFFIHGTDLPALVVATFQYKTTHEIWDPSSLDTETEELTQTVDFSCDVLKQLLFVQSNSIGTVKKIKHVLEDNLSTKFNPLSAFWCKNPDSFIESFIDLLSGNKSMLNQEKHEVDICGVTIFMSKTRTELFKRLDKGFLSGNDLLEDKSVKKLRGDGGKLIGFNAIFWYKDYRFKLKILNSQALSYITLNRSKPSSSRKEFNEVKKIVEEYFLNNIPEQAYNR